MNVTATPTMTLSEAIGRRRSVRAFDGRGLSDSERAAVTEALSAARSPFGGSWSACLADLGDPGTGWRTTYGMIRGAGDYIVLRHGADERSMLSAGFAVEQAVLEAVRRGLGTCWVGSTFRASRFEQCGAVPGAPQVVVALGHAKQGRSLSTALARLMSAGSKRMPAGRLFYNESVLYSLGEANRFSRALGLMRLAPSSLNSQPWRAIVRGATVDFFSTDGAKLNMIDMGIGQAHFAIGCADEGIAGEWRRADNHADCGDRRYIISFVAGD